MIQDGISNGKQQPNDAFDEEHGKRRENCGQTQVNQGEITATAKEKYSGRRQSDGQQDKSYGHARELPTEFRWRQRRNIKDDGDKGRHLPMVIRRSARQGKRDERQGKSASEDLLYISEARLSAQREVAGADVGMQLVLAAAALLEGAEQS